MSFGTAVVEEAKVADIGSPSLDAFKAAKEAGGFLVDQAPPRRAWPSRHPAPPGAVAPTRPIKYRAAAARRSSRR